MVRPAIGIAPDVTRTSAELASVAFWSSTASARSQTHNSFLPALGFPASGRFDNNERQRWLLTVSCALCTVAWQAHTGGGQTALDYW